MVFNKYKDWTKKTIFTALYIISLIVFVNYVNDPLWVFNHRNFTNADQAGFNERQQKTNRLYFQGIGYDSIMLGNSKVTYINQNHFTKGGLFNYAVSAMSPIEYQGYINFAKKVINADLKYIIIGLDFNACIKSDIDSQYKDLDFYINNTTSDFYKYKHLLSYDSFMYSLRNFIKYFDKKKSVYNHQNIKEKIGYDNLYDGYQFNLNKLKKESKSYKDVKYNYNLKNIFHDISNDNKDSNIVAIFLPELLPAFLFNNNSKKIYDRCVSDISKIAKVYNFMTLSQITTNPGNYYDGSHFRPKVGSDIIRAVE